MDSDQSVLFIFVILTVAVILFTDRRETPPKRSPDLEELGYVDLRPWGFEERNGIVAFFPKIVIDPERSNWDLEDFPGEFIVGGFLLKHRNSGKEPVPYFRIYGWEVSDLDPDNEAEKYYNDPLLKDEKGVKHVLVN